MKAIPPSRRRAEADLPEKLAVAVRLIVASMRHVGSDDATIRAAVAGGFKEALARDRPRSKTMDLGEHGGQELVTLDGVFRLVLDGHGSDRADLHKQETWWGIIEEAMDGALAGESER